MFISTGIKDLRIINPTDVQDRSMRFKNYKVLKFYLIIVNGTFNIKRRTKLRSNFTVIIRKKKQWMDQQSLPRSQISDSSLLIILFRLLEHLSVIFCLVLVGPAFQCPLVLVFGLTWCKEKMKEMAARCQHADV